MNYEWDVFLSYRRSGIAGPWVQGILAPALRQWLPQFAGSARVFLDVDHGITAGQDWRTALGGALARTRVLVPVLEAEFFRSDWCVAEFATAMARRALTGVDLVVPVRLADGDFWSMEAKALQHEDFEPWNTLRRPSAAPKGYHEAVKRLCRSISGRLAQAPPWDPAWPVHTPPAPPPLPPPEPRWTG